jgi:hypothetical protein
MNSLSSNAPFEAYKIYTACKLHFEGSYDFFRYNGKTSVTPKSFFARRDKFFFAKIAKRYSLDELKYFYACNFAHHGTKWIGNLNDELAHDTYKEYLGMMESFTYRFKNDIYTLVNDCEFKSLFAIDDGQYPTLVRKLVMKELPLETFVVLNRYLNFLPKFNKEITDPILWPDISRTILKYDKFIMVNNEKTKEALKDCLQSNANVV